MITQTVHNQFNNFYVLCSKYNDTIKTANNSK